jgi:hypothetical protein
MKAKEVYLSNSVLEILAKSDMTGEQFRACLLMLSEASLGEQPSDKLIQVQSAIVNSCKNSTKAV